MSDDTAPAPSEADRVLHDWQRIVEGGTQAMRSALSAARRAGALAMRERCARAAAVAFDQPAGSIIAAAIRALPPEEET